MVIGVLGVEILRVQVRWVVFAQHFVDCQSSLGGGLLNP